jgi:transposase InsO family protein
VYRFIDQYKTILGLRWLLRKFHISPNAYYNYLKQRKAACQQQKNQVKEEIKQIYYNNNRLLGHRVVRIFLLCKGIRLSKITVHKYMNKDLCLHAIVMRKKLRYVRGTKNKIFTNLLKQDFRAEAKNKIWCTDFIYT